ncbi:GNAT family N-acetyltransferase [Neobacillus cucumis]|uniref:GNAT family N-acetyltransferase n=1 Tax=Neobacillus cucumis TaxID=1740721 RepID=UPI00196470D3|nr:GNAT family N-acetyltransferase [Neobacillus cucumis]MBM7655932.1 ribosomal protein S18 acetylase RimI-like enzyme [Neobacillus cucumis]
MKFKIIPSKHMEAYELLKLQKEAFHSDLIKYKDYFQSPAAESLNYFILKMQTSLHYSIFVDGRLAGGICVVKQTKDHYYLYRIFLGSEFQNKGLGSKILQELEKQFPHVKKWSLDTPKDNRRNRHFYEKLGYIKTGEQQITKYLTLIFYEKNL